MQIERVKREEERGFLLHAIENYNVLLPTRFDRQWLCIDKQDGDIVVYMKEVKMLVHTEAQGGLE